MFFIKTITVHLKEMMMIEIIFYVLGMAGFLSIGNLFLYFKERDGPQREIYNHSASVELTAFIGTFISTLLLIFAFANLFTCSLPLSTIWLLFAIQTGVGIFIAIASRKKILEKCDKCFNKNYLAHPIWYGLLIMFVILFPASYILSIIISFILSICITNNIFYNSYKKSLEKDK